MKRISRILMGILLWQIPLFLNAQSSIHPPTQRVVGYYDSASGKCVLIAEVQDSQGQIVSSNHSIKALKSQKMEWKDRLAAAKSIRERMDKKLKDVLTAAQYAKLYSDSQQSSRK